MPATSNFLLGSVLKILPLRPEPTDDQLPQSPVCFASDQHSNVLKTKPGFAAMPEQALVPASDRMIEGQHRFWGNDPTFLVHDAQ